MRKTQEFVDSDCDDDEVVGQKRGDDAWGHRNNWPPLPKFCPIQPCFYQDINVDIPVEFQKTVKYLYYLWIGHVSLLLSNFVIGFLYLCLGDARKDVTESGGTMALALVYLFLFTPAAFVCWYRPAYKAFR